MASGSKAPRSWISNPNGTKPTSSAASRVAEARLQVLQAAQGPGSDAAGHAAADGEGEPAVGQLHGAADRALAVAAHPDGRVRLLHGARQGGVARRLEAVSREGHPVLAPDALHHPEGLVRELVAGREVDAQRGELAFQVAGGDAEDEPPAGGDIHGGRGLRGQERVAVGEHQHVGLEAQAGGGGGGDAEGHEGVQGVVAAAGEPAVLGDRVVGHEGGVEARVLGRPGHLADGGRGQELVGRVAVFGRELHREPHGPAA
jgi:hypothetical protein